MKISGSGASERVSDRTLIEVARERLASGERGGIERRYLVDLQNGELRHVEKPDFFIKSRGLDLQLIRNYQSHRTTAGLFGNAGNQQLLAALGIQGAASDSFRIGANTAGASRISEYSGGQPVGQGGFFDSLGTGLMTNGINRVNSGVDGMFQTQPYQSTPAFGNNGGKWIDSGGNQAYQQGYMGPK